jgi:mannose-6-phosphate isomerase
MWEPMGFMLGWTVVSVDLSFFSHKPICPVLTLLLPYFSFPIEIIELMATSDNVLNVGFVSQSEKDSIDTFVEAVTCEPKDGEEYKLKRSEWNLSSGAGAGVYQVSSPFFSFFTCQSGLRNLVDQVPTEEFSLYHVRPDPDRSTTIKPLHGPTVLIVTEGQGAITQIVDGFRTDVQVKRGQVYLVGADTEVEYEKGLEVWASFWDDQEEGQTGPA